MEDISRELEKEIELSRPKPYLLVRKTKIIIVDDFGGMKSGEYLKTLVKIFIFLTIVFSVTAGFLFHLYSGVSRNSNVIEKKLSDAEKKMNALTREKEVLMAKLVISGKMTEVQKQGGMEDTSLVLGGEEKSGVALEPGGNDEAQKDLPKDLVSGPEKSDKEPVEPEAMASDALSSLPRESEPGRGVEKTVSLEKFIVKKDRKKKDLLVQFDIRNLSKAPGDVEGRIFVLLKPDAGTEDQWLVVPESALLEGIPSEHRKGQYFSISHFKPVKFRIKNQVDPDFFTQASIFIFNEQGDLIFEERIDITEAE